VVYIVTTGLKWSVISKTVTNITVRGLRFVRLHWRSRSNDGEAYLYIIYNVYRVNLHIIYNVYRVNLYIIYNVYRVNLYIVYNVYRVHLYITYNVYAFYTIYTVSHRRRENCISFFCCITPVYNTVPHTRMSYGHFIAGHPVYFILP